MQASTLPWYRHPWPWLLMAGPAVAVVASLGSAYLAVEGADPIIEDHYYERGLDINATLQRVQRAADLGVRASVEYDGVQRGESVWVRVRSAQAIHDASLQVRLVHPSRAGTDQLAVLGRVPGSPDTNAEFTGQWPDGANVAPELARRPAAINWRITLQGADWQVEGDARGRNEIAAR
jgi:hypothetical protein